MRVFDGHYVLLLAMVLNFPLAACGDRDLPQGSLVLAYGAEGLRILDLGGEDRDLNVTVAKEFMAKDIASMGQGEFLVGGCSLGGICSVYLVDLADKSSTWFASGISPVYLEHLKAVILVDVAQDSNRPQFFLKSVSGSGKAKAIAPAPRMGLWDIRVVEMGNGQVAFQGEGGGIWILNVSASSIRKTALNGYVPVAWRAVAKTLIAMAVDSREIVEIDLATQTVKSLQLKGSNLSAVYSGEGDSLFYTKSRTSWLMEETHDLYRYDFKRRCEKKLHGRVMMTSGAFVP